MKDVFIFLIKRGLFEHALCGGLFMRKGIIVLSCMLLFTVWNISAQSDEPRYILYFDSKSKSDLNVKKEIIKIYDDLMEQVDESSRINLFELDENTKAFFLNGTLKIVIGDGQGLVLEGTFVKESCDIEVNKRSWLLELLNQ